MLLSMAQVAPRIPTFDELYAEIERLPGGVTGEIPEPGVLRTMARPGRGHGRAAKLCLRALGPFDGDVGGIGWWILVEAEIRFPGPRLLVPDLAGFRVERVPSCPRENPIETLPDWCCEILSPGTARVDRLEKLPRYAASGVGWIWLVDPELRSVEVFETVGGRPTLVATARDDDARALLPFEGELALEGWWVPDEGAKAPRPAE